MKPFEYVAADSLETALEELDHSGDIRLMAGGTDLILDLEFGHQPVVEALVDVTAIPGLDRIEEKNGWIELGAAATHTQIERSPLVLAHGQALVESCSVVGGPQVRNVATIGGNVAHALPAADGAIGLLTLDARHVVHCDDPATIERFLHDAGVKPHVRHAVDERTVQLKARFTPKRLQALLRDLDYLIELDT